MITVLLVDDHELVRLGVKSLLLNAGAVSLMQDSEKGSDGTTVAGAASYAVRESLATKMSMQQTADVDARGIAIIAEASSGEQAIRIAREKQPDVVLMDVKMPGIGGLEATRRLQRFLPECKVIAVTACEEDPFPSRLLQAGASGYLTKDCGVGEMVKAIRSVHAGNRYLNPQIAQQLALKHVEDTDATPFELLSERELQVMIMITSGYSVQEISDKLCLSPKTINTYRYRLFEKLNIDNDVELTHLAIRHGMIDKDLFEKN